MSNVVIVWLSIKAFAFSDVELFFGWMIKTNKNGLGDIETQPHTHTCTVDNRRMSQQKLFGFLLVESGLRQKIGTNTYYFCCCCVLETVKSLSEESRSTFLIYQSKKLYT